MIPVESPQHPKQTMFLGEVRVAVGPDPLIFSDALLLLRAALRTSSELSVPRRTSQARFRRGLLAPLEALLGHRINESCQHSVGTPS